VPKTLDTADVERMAADGAQLVEVLPAEDFQREHLPGAISIPLADMTAERVERLDPRRAVITYCYDHQCDLSARAAALLEVLGCSEVYDYTASKAAWLACGLPSEGSVRSASRAGAIARTDVATCGPDATVGDLPDRGPEGSLTVVVADDVVVGVVRPEARQLPPDLAVRDAMLTAAPSVRPSITAAELAKSMDKDGQRWVLVTHLDGVLVGVVHREDLDGQH
jgi:rhodanese-related sulfurtransferase/CBS domain-containing protein